jgi:hypothetical protein
MKEDMMVIMVLTQLDGVYDFKTEILSNHARIHSLNASRSYRIVSHPSLILSMCSISCRGDVAKSNGIPSTILGMMSAPVNLVLGGCPVITGKPIGDQNMEIMTTVVDMIVLGRDCGISPSESRIRPKSIAQKNQDTSPVKA